MNPSVSLNRDTPKTEAEKIHPALPCCSKQQRAAKAHWVWQLLMGMWIHSSLRDRQLDKGLIKDSQSCLSHQFLYAYAGLYRFAFRCTYV